jgi:hypothetical protein
VPAPAPTPAPTPAPAPAGGPLSLGFDTATPHQISIRCLQSRAPASGTTAHAYYRVGGSSAWIDAGLLYLVTTAEGSAVDKIGFAGFILDLVPGTTYDVRVDVNEPGAGSWTITNTHATRALPAENTAQTKTATPANWTSVLAGAVAGDVIVLQNGTYSTTGLTFNSPGTASNPVYIRGQSRSGVIIACTSGTLLQINGGHAIWENITFRGSRTDGDGASMGIGMSGAVKTNITIRHCTFDGFDRGIKAFDPVQGMLVYDCEFLGNNGWAVVMLSEQGTSSGWNDDGVGMPGIGNCVWNCTFQGHGDTIKLGEQSHSIPSYACYMHHSWVKWGADDGFEFDDAGGNNAFYNCIIENTATAFSADTNGGPTGCVRNVFINQGRHPLKINGQSAGVKVLNCTFISTNKAISDYNYAFRCPGGLNYGFQFKNNLVVYTGSGDLANCNGSYPNSSFGNNAWFPDRPLQWGGSFLTTVAAWRSGQPSPGDVALSSSNPFANAVTLAATYATQYTGQVNVALAAGSNARSAGTVIPNVTDGFTGAAPDIGAFISGQNYGSVGCAWNSAVIS